MGSITDFMQVADTSEQNSDTEPPEKMSDTKFTASSEQNSEAQDTETSGGNNDATETARGDRNPFLSDSEESDSVAKSSDQKKAKDPKVLNCDIPEEEIFDLERKEKPKKTSKKKPVAEEFSDITESSKLLDPTSDKIKSEASNGSSLKDKSKISDKVQKTPVEALVLNGKIQTGVVEARVLNQQQKTML